MALIKIEGGGTVSIGTDQRSDGVIRERFMSLDVTSTMTFFKSIAVRKPDLVGNFFGLYSFGTISRGGKVKWATLNVPEYVLQARKNGCLWNPKGTSSMDITSVTPCEFDYMGQQCPDFIGDCLRGLLGTGRDVHDILATPQGKLLFGQILAGVYDGIGNSLWESLEFGQHPATADANTNNTYSLPDHKWADYMGNQEICRGRITHLEYLKAQTTGHENFKVVINAGDIDGTDNSIYTGDPSELFKRMVKAAPTDFRTYIRKSRTGTQRPVIEVSRAIFDAYEEELLTKFPNIPNTLHLFYTGKFCDANNCIEQEPIPGVLKWKNYAVVCRDEWDSFDDVHNIITHRAIMSAPGVYGLAFDIPELTQFKGMGLNITQKINAPDRGMIYFDTSFEAANAILNKDWVIYASLEVVPNV